MSVLVVTTPVTPVLEAWCVKVASQVRSSIITQLSPSSSSLLHFVEALGEISLFLLQTVLEYKCPECGFSFNILGSFSQEKQPKVWMAMPFLNEQCKRGYREQGSRAAISFRFVIATSFKVSPAAEISHVHSWHIMANVILTSRSTQGAESDTMPDTGNSIGSFLLSWIDWNRSARCVQDVWLENAVETPSVQTLPKLYIRALHELHKYICCTKFIAELHKNLLNSGILSSTFISMIRFVYHTFWEITLKLLLLTIFLIY